MCVCEPEELSHVRTQPVSSALNGGTVPDHIRPVGHSSPTVNTTPNWVFHQSGKKPFTRCWQVNESWNTTGSIYTVETAEVERRPCCACGLEGPESVHTVNRIPAPDYRLLILETETLHRVCDLTVQLVPQLESLILRGKLQLTK